MVKVWPFPLECDIAVNTVWSTVHTVIHRSAAERLQANDVIRLEAVRGSSNMPIERQFLTVFGGIWTPKCCRPSCGPQKRTSLRHNAYFELLCTKIHARVTSVGESLKKIKKRCLIFHVFRQALPYGRLAQNLGYVFVSWTYSIVQTFIIIG